MSRKNHQVIDGRLLQTDKQFSQLKTKQKEKINEWLYQEYRRVYIQIGRRPDKRHNDEILFAAYKKIEQAKIWIPFGEVKRYFFSKKNTFHRRFTKEQERTGERQDVG